MDTVVRVTVVENQTGACAIRTSGPERKKLDTLVAGVSGHDTEGGGGVYTSVAGRCLGQI